MSAIILPFDRSPLTPTDEALMAVVAADLERLGFEVARKTGRNHDGYVIRLPWTVHPLWTIGRRHTGRYETQNGFGAVIRSGKTLKEALLPGWMPASATEGTESRPSTGAS